MQLSKQCTWISLNLTRISNQARGWVEGVFSSSMYVSSNQNVQESTSQSRPPTIYKPPQRTSRWPLSLGWKRGHRMLLSDHRMLDPQRPVLRGWPRVLLESRMWVSNGYLQHTGRSTGPHRTRPVHTGLMRREYRKTAGSPDVSHRTHPERLVLTRLKHKEGCKTPSHRTLTTGRSQSASGAQP